MDLPTAVWASVGRSAGQATMTFFRIAGSVGCGGPAEILFSPARGGEAKMLEEGVGDHSHQLMAMKTSP